MSYVRFFSSERAEAWCNSSFCLPCQLHVVCGRLLDSATFVFFPLKFSEGIKGFNIARTVSVAHSCSDTEMPTALAVCSPVSHDGQ